MTSQLLPWLYHKYYLAYKKLDFEKMEQLMRRINKKRELNKK